LDPGWAQVRLGFADSAFGRPFRVAVDMPPVSNGLSLEGVTDGITWERNAVRTSDGKGFLSCWMKGLPENSDRANIKVTLGETRLAVVWVGEQDTQSSRQFNVEVPERVAKGNHRLRIACGGAAVETDVTVR
jgi:hypothetical protein